MNLREQKNDRIKPNLLKLKECNNEKFTRRQFIHKKTKKKNIVRLLCNEIENELIKLTVSMIVIFPQYLQKTGSKMAFQTEILHNIKITCRFEQNRIYSVSSSLSYLEFSASPDATESASSSVCASAVS